MTDTKLHPSAILMNLLVTILAPMFLGVAAGDIDLARAAALATINDYRARNQADLIAVAQIIAFGLAALGSLSLSMEDDLSLNMTLRLRGNANALNRSAEQNRRALNQTPHAEPAPPPAPPEIDLEPFLNPIAEQLLAAEAEARLQTATSENKRDRERATTKTAEINAALPALPPAEQKSASMRMAALSSTAHNLLHPAPLPPNPYKHP